MVKIALCQLRGFVWHFESNGHQEHRQLSHYTNQHSWNPFQWCIPDRTVSNNIYGPQNIANCVAEQGFAAILTSFHSVTAKRKQMHFGRRNHRQVGPRYDCECACRRQMFASAWTQDASLKLWSFAVYEIDGHSILQIDCITWTKAIGDIY